MERAKSRKRYDHYIDARTGKIEDINFAGKSTLNLSEKAEINISGKLVSDVSGNGNLNVKSSSALIDGNVSGSNLTFEADHSLSKAFSGTIGDLASLNVNKGTLTYDKQTGKIGNLNVTGGLDIGTNTVNATNVDFKDNSSLALRVAATDNYGKINADNITIGKDTTMKVTLDNGVVGNGENTDLKFLNGKVTGSFTNKIAENSRYDIKWNEDGSLNITGTATASDVVTDAGGTTSNAATAEAWDTLVQSTTASANAKAVASVLNDLSQETSAAGKKAYVDALTAVAPEVAPMVQKTQTKTANQVFGAVSTRLTGGSISTGSEGMSSGDSIFTGLVRCGCCGSLMTCETKVKDENHSYNYLKCNKLRSKCSQKPLNETKILKQLENELCLPLAISDDMLKNIKAEVKKRLKEENINTANLKRDITIKLHDLDEQIKTLFRGYIQGKCDEKMYNELKTEIELEKEKLQKDMDRYLEIDTETDEILANIAEVAANVGKFLKSPIISQKRDILN